MARWASWLCAVAAVVTAACAPGIPASCAPVEGGAEGATVQLRYAAAGERYLAFTFGARAGVGGMAVPRYRIERSAPGSFAVELRGTFTRNPDGSPSYDARRIAAKGVDEAALVSDADGVLRWSVRAEPSACPAALERVYVGSSTFPRAQLFVTLGTSSAVTLEPPAAAPNAPVTVGGLGFTPGSAVTVEVDGKAETTTTADANGVVNTALFVPAVGPGEHPVRVRDGAGRSATIALEVTAR